jgi:hypothetical protein
MYYNITFEQTTSIFLNKKPHHIINTKFTEIIYKLRKCNIQLTSKAQYMGYIITAPK